MNKLNNEILELKDKIVELNTDIETYISKLETFKQLTVFKNRQFPLLYHRNIGLCSQRSLFHIYNNTSMLNSVMDELQLTPNQIIKRKQEYYKQTFNFYLQVIAKLNDLYKIFLIYFNEDNDYYKNNIKVIDNLLNLIKFTINKYSSSKEDVDIYDLFEIKNDIDDIINNIKLIMFTLPKGNIFMNNVNKIIGIISEI